MSTKAVFDNIAEHLEEQIDLAENKIVVAVAWFTNKRLFDALCNKAADGVKVKLIISDNEINRNSNIDYGDIQIGKSKLFLIDEEKMHNKFCIIDDYIVITGSYNWSYIAESNFENILICSGDNDLVKQYKNEVKKIIKDYLPENDIKPKSPWEEAIKSGSIKPFGPSGLKLKDYNTPFVRPSTKNDFESIKIGKQEWMVKNLDVDRFRNGDLIPHIKDGKEWKEAGQNYQPAWCYYDNNSENGKIYGKLYNWYAVNDERELAPAGWHVPSDGEWTVLTTFLGGESVAGDKMKCLWGRNDWEDEGRDIWNGNGNNFSGFNALPGGLRSGYGDFRWIRRGAFFWSASIVSLHMTDLRDLHSNTGLVSKSTYDKSFGASVRCIKGSLSSRQFQVFKPDDIKRYIFPFKLK
jgi:uncharacterized protein (TIGR02145 family)